MKRISFFLICLIVSLQIQAQGSFNCFSVLAGKKATTDGSVLFAHNEDDYGDVYFNIYVVPGSNANISGSIAHEAAGPEAGSADGNCRYLWLEMPGMHFSDSYMNEFGVVIASDACPSREDQPELTDGGITWELRNTMAREARSARHAVEIARALIEERGYNSSGRTYCIADPNEAWMLSVVNGKRFVAKRIPDDAVAVIPNYYTITDVNLNDRQNVIASPDLITYAEKRGWYNPKQDGQFSFRKAYGSEQSLRHPVNMGRMWAGYRLLSEKEAEYGQEFPWVFVPANPVDVSRLMEVLSDHYEGTHLDALKTGKPGNPHDAEPGAICAEHTRYGFVAHLQGRHPLPLGCVMWLAPYRPCVQAWFPLYAVMTASYKSFAINVYEHALGNHFDAPSPAKEANPGHAYWNYLDFTDHIDENYSERSPAAARLARSLTRANLSNHEQVMAQALALYEEDPLAAAELLTRFSIECTSRSIEMQGNRFNFQKPSEFKTQDQE
jgi:dipeptidase